MLQPNMDRVSNHCQVNGRLVSYCTRLDSSLGMPPGASMRILPYLIVVVLTGIQGVVGGVWPFWIYFLKCIVGALIVLLLRRYLLELQLQLNFVSVAIGIMLFLVWVFADPLYPKFSEAESRWQSLQSWHTKSVVRDFLIAVRIFGSTVIMPPIEELFYRSFIYRWLQSHDFSAVSLQRWSWKAAFISSAIFGLAHREWLAGFICGMAFQWLVFRHGNLGAAIVAHGVTNLILGLWVLVSGDWKFWG